MTERWQLHDVPYNIFEHQVNVESSYELSCSPGFSSFDCNTSYAGPGHARLNDKRFIRTVYTGSTTITGLQTQRKIIIKPITFLKFQ